MEVPREISLRGNMLDKILNRRNIERAINVIERNDGAGGVDDQQSDELRPFVNANCKCLVNTIKDGSYQPSPVRKVDTESNWRNENVGHPYCSGQDDPTSHLSGVEPGI